MNNLDLEIQTLDESRQMRNLANAVRLADSFSLLFVRCNQRPRQKEIIEELQKQLADYRIEVILLENQIEHLLDELQARLGDEKPDAVFVYGLESSFPKADEAAESKFVVTLNHSRNSFKRVLDCPLVLFLPEYALSAIYHGATDFYSIRSGVYLFSAKAEEIEQLILKYSVQEQKESEALLLKQRQSQIRTINGLLIEYQSLPSSQRNFDIEVGLKEKLAQLYYISGNYEVSSAIYQEIIKYAENIKDEFLLARNLNSLAMIYREQKKYDKAVAIQKKSVEITKKILGMNHSNYATSLSTLATIYLQQGKPNEVIKLSEEVIKIDKKTIGTNNPIHAVHLNILASAYSNQGRYDEAIKAYEKSIDIVKETVGISHLDYANRLNNLAVVYLRQEKYQKALRLFKEAYETASKMLGKNHHITKDIKTDVEICRKKIKKQASRLIPYKN